MEGFGWRRVRVNVSMVDPLPLAMLPMLSMQTNLILVFVYSNARNIAFNNMYE